MPKFSFKVQVGSTPPTRPRRRKWQSTLVFLLEKSHGQRNLAVYNPWGRKSLTQLSNGAQEATSWITWDTMKKWGMGIEEFPCLCLVTRMKRGHGVFYVDKPQSSWFLVVTWMEPSFRCFPLGTMNWFWTALARDNLPSDKYSIIRLFIPGVLNPKESLQDWLKWHLLSKMLPECFSWAGKWFVGREDTCASLGSKDHEWLISSNRSSYVSIQGIQRCFQRCCRTDRENQT